MSESTNPRHQPSILPPQPDPSPSSAPDEPPAQGPSLVLLYSILAAVIVFSMIIAGLIVLPFYLRR